MWSLEEAKVPQPPSGDRHSPESSLTPGSSAPWSQKRPLPADCSLSAPPRVLPLLSPAAHPLQLARTCPSHRQACTQLSVLACAGRDPHT